MWALAENKVPVNLDLVSVITKEADRAMGDVTVSIRFDIPGGNPVVWMFDDVNEREQAYGTICMMIMEAQEKPKRGRPPKVTTETTTD